MKRLELIPNGWACTLDECPPGHFLFHEMVGFKSEYRNNEGRIEAYCDTGEAFWGGTTKHEDTNKLIVQPLTARWIDEAE